MRGAGCLEDNAKYLAQMKARKLINPGHFNEGYGNKRHLNIKQK